MEKAKPLVNLEQTMEVIEGDQIIEALKNNDTVSRAADWLGTKRTTLNNKMKKLGIDPQRFLNLGKSRPLQKT